MSTPPPEIALPANTAKSRDDGGREARQILRLVFIAVPLVAGLDKLFHRLANWNQYLAPVVTDLVARLGLSSQAFVVLAGVVEIGLSFLVAVKPRIGAVALAVWLAGVIANLVLMRAFYDVALCDFGLCLGAIALARLSRKNSN